LRSLIELISSHPLFNQLPAETLKVLAQSAIQKTYAAREIIVHQGMKWPCLFLMEKGKINALKESQGGRAFVATTLKPGDIFWGLAFFVEDAAMPVLLQAISLSVIYIWRRELLLPVIQRNSSMSWTLCQIMIERMQLASDIVEELAFQPVIGRLARLLLDVFGEGDGMPTFISFCGKWGN
jgi:CRP-like cAMP-binding protein